MWVSEEDGYERRSRPPTRRPRRVIRSQYPALYSAGFRDMGAELADLLEADGWASGSPRRTGPGADPPADESTGSEGTATET
jgi:hypothetical protein